MPSMRPYPLDPRAPTVPARVAVPAAAPPAPLLVRAPAAPPAADATDNAEDESGAGGFHESSYELQHGLLVSESDWPEDVTVPGRLGER